MASDTRTLKVVVTGESTSAARALRDVGNEASNAESRFGKLATSFAEWGARGAVALGAAGGAAAVMGVQTASGMEQARIAFTNMLGSGKKADDFLHQLSDFAAKTPFEFPELVQSSQMLLAMGFKAKDLIPTLTAVGDAVAGMGGSGEQVQTVVRALGQMQAKGRIAGEEILQMTEQGIPAMKILADGYGVSTAQMQKMVEKGQVLSDKAIPLLVKGLEHGTKSVKGFGGMMEQQSGTVQGKWSTFMDTVKTGLGNIAEKAFPAINGALSEGTKKFDGFFKGLTEGKRAADGTSDWANQLGLGIRALGEAFENGDVTSDGFVGGMERIGVVLRRIVDWLKTDGVKYWNQFTDILGVIVDKTKTVIEWAREHETVVKVVVAAVAAFIVVGKAYNVTTAAMAAITKIHAAGVEGLAAKSLLVRGIQQSWIAVQWLLNAAMSANPIAKVIIVLSLLAAGLKYAYDHSETFRKAVDGLWDGCQKAFKFIGDAFSAMWNNVLKPGIRFVVDGFLGMVDLVLEGAENMFGWVPGIGPKLQQAHQDFRKFRDNVNATLSGINDQKVTVSGDFTSPFKAVVNTAKMVYVGNGRYSVRAYGGPIGGPGSSTSDSIPTLLSNGEHVWSAREVMAAGGHKAVASMRRAVLGLARGGPVFDVATKLSAAGATQMASITNAVLPVAIKKLADAAVKNWTQMINLAGGGKFLYPFGPGHGPGFPWGHYPSGAVHRALDFPIPIGTPVHAGMAGTVMRAGWDTTGFGWHVRTHDVDGNYTIYGHLSRILARVGQTLTKFGVLGLSGNSGNSTGPHTHVERRHILYDPSTSFRFDGGGWLPPGRHITENFTGQSEWVSPPGQGRGITVIVNVAGNVTTEKDLAKAITKDVRDELLRHAGRNGGRTGLPNK